MARPLLFANPEITQLQSLLESIRQGTLLFPEFQRGYVWSDEQRKMLFDSVLQGMPIGSFMVWRTPDEFRSRALALGDRSPQRDPMGSFNYVLDGLQRLMTLYSALVLGDRDVEGAVAGRRPSWRIFYDLEQDLDSESEGEKRFKIKSNGDVPLTWMPLAALMNDAQVWEIQTKLFNAGRSQEANRAKVLAQRFATYHVPVIPLSGVDLNFAARTFERINNQGTSMGEPAMMRALLYSRLDLEERFSSIVEELPWATLDPTVMVNTLKVMGGDGVYSSNLRALAEKIGQDSAMLDRLRAGVRAAVDFLFTRCGVQGEPALPYAYQLVALAVAAAKGLDLQASGVSEELQRWFWATTAGEYFKGLNEGQLRQVFEDVERIARGRRARLLRRLSAHSTEQDSESADRLSLPDAPVETFNSTAVRSLLQMHLLARRDLVDSSGRPVDGLALLARGSETFVKLYLELGAEDPANRILAAPEDARKLRQVLNGNVMWTARCRDGHLLPPLKDSASVSPPATLAWRRARLWAIERAFIAEQVEVVEEPDSEDEIESALNRHAEESARAARLLGDTPTAEQMVAWFFDHYEDPANGVPFDGREGGYQYALGGGPCEADDVLHDAFPLVAEETIEEAVSQILGHGWEWVKSGIY